MTVEELVRKQVDEMEVGAVSLVQTGAVPDSNGFLVVQMGADTDPVTVDPSNLSGICEAYIEIIQSAPEIALQMAAIDSLAVALRSSVSPENAPESVVQNGDIAAKIAGWDTWQGFQEYVHENVHSPEDAIRAIDELATLQKSEFVTQQTPTGEEDHVTHESPEVTQALAAIEASEQALAQARAALGASNKLAAGTSPNLREEDTRPLAAMGDNDGDEETDDESDEEDDGETENAAGANLDQAMDGSRDTALTTRDAADKNWQNIKKTNTVVPPAATEATHPRTAPKHPAPEIAGTKAPGTAHTDPTTVNQSDEEVLQAAGEILSELTTQETTEGVLVEQGLWAGFLSPLDTALTQGHPPTAAPPSQHPVAQSTEEAGGDALPEDPAVLQEALKKATARIAELETRGAARSRPASRQSDADAAPVTQGKASGLWDNLIPGV